jgi:hypothetical protein
MNRPSGELFSEWLSCSAPDFRLKDNGSHETPAQGGLAMSLRTSLAVLSILAGLAVLSILARELFHQGAL